MKTHFTVNKGALWMYIVYATMNDYWCHYEYGLVSLWMKTSVTVNEDGCQYEWVLVPIWIKTVHMSLWMRTGVTVNEDKYNRQFTVSSVEFFNGLDRDQLLSRDTMHHT